MINYYVVEFVVACIRRILTMYEGITHPPKSVVIVGHSMVRNIAIFLSNGMGFTTLCFHLRFKVPGYLQQPKTQSLNLYYYFNVFNAIH